MLRINGESCYGFANACTPKHSCQLRVFSIYQGSAWRDLAFIDPHDASPIRRVKWDENFECGFFRETSTGSGTTENTNCENCSCIGLVGISKREKFIESGVVSRDDMGSIPYLRPRVPINEGGKWKHIFYVNGITYFTLHILRYACFQCYRQGRSSL